MDGVGRRINFDHLLYFWTVAREGTVAQAASKLRLRSPTVSAQVHALEASLHAKLFVRSGRRLLLTDAGRVAFRYADEIFGLGESMRCALSARPSSHLPRLVVGVFDVVPSTVAATLLAPARSMSATFRVDIEVGRPEELLRKFDSGAIDLLLSDDMLDTSAGGETLPHSSVRYRTAIYGSPALASRYQPSFPASLDGAPFLMPSHTSLRLALTHWFDDVGVRPQVRGEVNNDSLLCALAADGLGLLAMPVIDDERLQALGLEPIGVVAVLESRFFVAAPVQRVAHPAVRAILDAAASRDEVASARAASRMRR